MMRYIADNPAVGGGLWRHRPFMLFWGGQAFSLIGTQVTQLAVPSLAVLTLHASPLSVGIISAAGFAAYPVLGVVAGPVVDRFNRRHVLMAADAVRLVAIAAVPTAYALGVMNVALLTIVSAVMGLGAVFFDTASVSYVPELVWSEHLVEANTKSQLTFSLSNVVGPAAAGFLVQFLGAARAVTADALSYVISLGSLALIPDLPKREAPPVARSVKDTLSAGFRFVAGSDILRRITAANATANLGAYMVIAALYPYSYRVLRLSPVEVGAALGLASVALVLGTIVAPYVFGRVQLRWLLPGCLLIESLAFLAMPLAEAIAPAVILTLSLSLYSAQAPSYDITQLTLRQQTAPVEMLGRVSAAMRTVFWGAIPLGLVIGGYIGSAFGSRAAILVGGCVVLLSAAAYARLGSSPRLVATAGA